MKVGSLVVTDSYGDAYETHVGLVLEHYTGNGLIDPIHDIAPGLVTILWDNGRVDEGVNPIWLRPIQTTVPVYNS
mgnify:CR=1 FL=1